MPRKSHRGVHPSPWQCTLSHTCHAKAPAERRRPRDARAYIRPLAEHQVPHLPRKSHRQSDERRRPRDARAYIRPLAENQVPHLPRKSHRQSGGDQGTPGHTTEPHTQKPPAEPRRARNVHPTPCRAPSAAPATQKSPAERRRPRDATAHTCHAKATGRAAETRKVHCQGVKCKPWRPLSLRFLAWQAWDNVYCYGVGCTPWRPLGLRLYCVAGVGQCTAKGRMHALASLGSPSLLRGRCTAGSDARPGVP